MKAGFQHELFFEMSAQPMFVAGRDGLFKSVNPAFSHALGFSAQELLSRPYLDFVATSDVDMFIQTVNQIFSGVDTSEFAVKMLSIQGQEVILSWRVRVVGDYLHAIAYDFGDERKGFDRGAKAHAHPLDLQSPTAIFKRAFDQVGVGFAFSDLKWKVVNTNSEFLKAVGRDVNQLHLSEVLPIERRDLERLRDSELAKLTVEFSREENGDHQWFLSTTSALTTADGSVDGFITALKNVTSQKVAEEEARKIAHEFRILLDANPSIIWTSDNSGNTYLINDRWFEVTGSKRHENFVDNLRDSIHPDDRDACMDYWAKCAKSGEVFEYQYRLYSAPFKDYRWFLGRSLPLRNESGEIERWLGSATDIHDQVMAQQALKMSIEITQRHNNERAELTARERSARESSRLKSEFLANMSHEIRTPLNGVIGMTNLLMETKLTKQQSEYASTIYASSQALMGLLSDILDLSKIEAGKLALENETVGLRELIADIDRVMGLSARRKGLEFKCTLARDLQSMYISGDSVRLNQILLNLIQNAIKFTAEGRVQLMVTQIVLEGRLRFEVIDTGVGIPADAQTTIFDAFEQADRTTTRKFGGTGLGLSICKKLVEAMDGQIGVRSIVGAGSQFWFELPLKRVKPPKVVDISCSKRSRKNQKLAGKRILVAEDNETNQKVIYQILKNEGCIVFLAANGIEAVELNNQNKFDAILMDCHMPEMDGYSAASIICANDTAPKVIALTADVLRGTREKCLQAGMVGYLTKPIDPERLRKALTSSKSELLKLLDYNHVAIGNSVLNRKRLAVLDEVGDNGVSDMTAEIVDNFFRNMPERVMMAKKAFQNNDRAKLKFETHSMKSIARLLGADRFGHACEDIEKTAMEDTVKGLRIKFATLESAYSEAMAALRKEMQRRRKAV